MKLVGGTVFTVLTYVPDNCADSGTIDVSGYTLSPVYDAGVSGAAVAAGGFYTVYSGLRGCYYYLESSPDASTWTTLAGRDLQTAYGCGIYLTDGVHP